MNLKKVSANIFSFFISLVLCLVVLELTLRLFGFGQLSYQKYDYIQHAEYSPFLIFGPNVDRTFEQKQADRGAHFNSQGFRREEEVPLKKPEGLKRIIALGGSTTENIPNQHNKHYCGEAEKIFQLTPLSDGSRAECLNASKSGYSTAQTLIRLEYDLIAFEPDVVTVMHNINDLSVNFFPENSRTNYSNKYFNNFFAPSLTDVKKTLLRKSAAAVFLGKLYFRMKSKMTAQRMKAKDGKIIYSGIRFNSEKTELFALEQFRRNLISMAAVSKAHGFRLVLMTQPALFSDEMLALAYGQKEYNDDILYPPLPELAQHFAVYNEVIRQTAREQGVDLIDMYELMGHEEKFFMDMNHFTVEGIERFGKIYAGELRKILEAA